MLSNDECKKLDIILDKYDNSESMVIAIMQEIQRKYNYLPEDVLSYAAKKIGISEAKIYGVATFYENFSLEPKGHFVIKVCNGTACHVRNSIEILQEFRKELNLSEENNTTFDNLFTIETVSCLGACGLAPVCTVNDVVYPKMTKAKVHELISNLRESTLGENK